MAARPKKPNAPHLKKLLNKPKEEAREVKQQRIRARKAKEQSKEHRLTGTKSIYRAGLSEALKVKLDHLADLAPHDRHDLGPEVDVARILSEEAVQLFDAAFNGKTPDGKTVPALMKDAAAENLKKTMVFVADMVNKSAKARALHSAVVDSDYLDFLVDETQRIVSEHVMPMQGGKYAVEKIMADLAKIELPERNNSSGDALAVNLREALGTMQDSIPSE